MQKSSEPLGTPGAPETEMPCLFISHGAPSLPIEQSTACEFFTSLGRQLPRPKAILIISAHWETAQPALLTGAQPLDTIYDFYGFPEPLYRMRYPAPGIGQLGSDIAATLRGAGFAVSTETKRGLDHGAWVPLYLMYPDADIPVSQLSVVSGKSPEYHFRLGQVLANLRRENILIVGSGTMTHNLGDVGNFHGERNDTGETDYVREFSRWMEGKITAQDIDALTNYRNLAPHATRAHPTEEHLMPFYVALGAVGDQWQAELVHRSCVYNVINLDCYAFRSTNDRHSIANPATTTHQEIL